MPDNQELKDTLETKVTKESLVRWDQLVPQVYLDQPDLQDLVDFVEKTDHLVKQEILDQVDFLDNSVFEDLKEQKEHLVKLALGELQEVLDQPVDKEKMELLDYVDPWELLVNQEHQESMVELDCKDQ